MVAVMAVSERHLLPGLSEEQCYTRLMTFAVSRGYVSAEINRMTELHNKCKPMMSVAKFRRGHT